MKLYILSLLPLVTAHFDLIYPPSRGSDESKMATFPCGDLSPSSSRTQVSLSNGSFPVALKLGHDETALEVLLSLGNDPGTNFNITLVPTFQVLGLGAFCLGDVPFGEGVLGTNVVDGMNATVQVQSNAHPVGGLYACADIQFSSTTQSEQPSSCTNNTGITASAFSGDAAHRNANESTAEGQAQSGSSNATTSSTSASADAAAALQTVSWGVLGGIFLGGIAVM
ncbi:hypothetical protein ASPWEDRAFT_24192 [Aspergillus wentii DTO 134E9]|uniref:Copper acquisition factor BIM1-like domain-containing protein n=1 Tax=Aspergillus wentii DTO 134E9 TaxID=1073089 RepID=A0A1L9RTI9_ASPWE|nr:uncharacterized protein ASPWEDRAFT_24192 [Aspergillus wentii DTO 134E9]OJJ38235.1 hypothetical protein ASPWEDRAFT_24192 [Aspergillus wentii DTO 134E9]